MAFGYCNFNKLLSYYCELNTEILALNVVIVVIESKRKSLWF